MTLTGEISVADATWRRYQHDCGLQQLPASAAASTLFSTHGGQTKSLVASNPGSVHALHRDSNKMGSYSSFFWHSARPTNGTIQPVIGWRQSFLSRLPRSRAGWGGTLALHLGLLAFVLFSIARATTPTAGTALVISVALQPLSPNTEKRDSLVSTTQPDKVREPPTRAEPVTTVDRDVARPSKEGMAPKKAAEPPAAPENSPAAPNQSADTQMATGSETQGAIANELLSMLLNQIKRCWVPPLGTAAPTTILHFEVFLNFDGSVAQPPQLLAVTDDPYFRAAADSARRAIYACAPYELPTGRFSEWHVISDLGIAPALMSGG